MSVNYVPDDWKIVATDNTPANRSVSGYGGQIPTRYTITSPDNRTRRVYAICYSNAASFYCISHGKRLFIQDWRFP
jgi:hypothetical protein